MVNHPPYDLTCDLTVAICTYNGAERLPDVLECLQACQSFQLETIAPLRWEVLVIDNNSQDATPMIVEAYQTGERSTGWGTVALRYVLESRQGLAYARQRAIEAANAPIVGFLDDDNLPEPDWPLAVAKFMEQHPQVGAIGSRVFPRYETEPPPDFERVAPFLAITDRGDRPRPYPPQQGLLPPGAGLAVRRSAWLATVPPQLQLLGRVGGQMLAGEDLEALSYLQRSGWEIWYNPAMRIAHKIPAARLTRSYLDALMYGIGLSRCRTRMLKYDRWQQPFMLGLYAVHDLARLLRHIWQWRDRLGQAMRESTSASVVPHALLRLYWGSLLSPIVWYGRRRS